MHTLSPDLPITKDAVILLIVSSSSAAFAHITFESLSSSSYTEIAIESYTSSAFPIIFDILLYVSKSLWNHFLTFIISTPHLRKYAAASNVLTPVLKVKFFVSIIIPEYKASASKLVNSGSELAYSISSVTSSEADEAYTSWNVRVAVSI